MDKVILATLIFCMSFNQLFASSFSFSDFKGGSIIDTVKDKGKEYITQGGIQDKVTGILDDAQNKALDSVTDYILKEASILSGEGKNLLQHCYQYKPKPAKEFNFSLDPCKLFTNDLDPCSVAPDLSSLGYTKISWSLNEKIKLKDHCTNAVNWSKDFAKNNTPEWIKDKLENIDTNVSIYNKIRNKVEGKEDTVKESTIKDTAIDVNKAIESKNEVVLKAIESNNYEAYSTLKDIVEVMPVDRKGQLDFRNTTIGYETIDDYEKSKTDLTNLYIKYHQTSNIENLKDKALFEFKKVNYDTTDTGEQAKQKNAIQAKVLEDFKRELDIHKDLEIDREIRLSVIEDEQVVYPTQQVLVNLSNQNRLNMIYLAEKQKIKEATITAKVTEKYNKIYLNGKKEIEKAMIHSIPFNRELEYQKIMLELNSIGASK